VELAEKGSWQTCQNCRRPVKQDGGCLHMRVSVVDLVTLVSGDFNTT
jgi:hypothetical protein